MQRIYVGQTGLKIEVQSGAAENNIDLTGATCEILIKKPSGGVKTFNASVEEDTLFNITISDPADLDEAGVYQLQSKITRSNLVALGKTAVFEVRNLFN